MNLEDGGRLVSKLREAGGQGGGGSPALQVQHPKVLKRREGGDCLETFDISPRHLPAGKGWCRARPRTCRTGSRAHRPT